MTLVQSGGHRPVELHLSRDLVRNIKRGHAWVFRDALKKTPAAEAGAHALLKDRKGRPLARGYYDPEGILAFRVCSTRPSEALDDPWAAQRMSRALSVRRRGVLSASTTGYRLFNGEGDGLPGLVCDVYGDAAVIKLDGPIARAFWDAKGIAQWVAAKVGVTTVYERMRTRGEAEGRPLVGDAPESPVSFLEHGLRFTADLKRGQKTGFFLDQRENRARIRQWSKGARVLNLFAYTGGFSVYATAGGAEHVITVDLARPAVEAATEHMRLNGIPDAGHSEVTADVFEYLDAEASAGNTYDLVIVDPPSFAHNRQSLPGALKAYTRLATLGCRVTAPGGMFVAASCSSHVDAEAFRQVVEEGVGAARRRATLLQSHGQPPDHPTPLPMAELRYLKCLFMQLD